MVVAAAVGRAVAQQKPGLVLDDPSDLQDPSWVQAPRFHYRGFHRPQVAARWP